MEVFSIPVSQLHPVTPCSLFPKEFFVVQHAFQLLSKPQILMSKPIWARRIHSLLNINNSIKKGSFTSGDVVVNSFTPLLEVMSELHQRIRHITCKTPITFPEIMEIRMLNPISQKPRQIKLRIKHQKKRSMIKLNLWKVSNRTVGKVTHPSSLSKARSNLSKSEPLCQVKGGLEP